MNSKGAFSYTIYIGENGFVLLCCIVGQLFSSVWGFRRKYTI